MSKKLFLKIYCRTFQVCMKTANYFIGYRMPEYIEGPGSLLKLPEMLKEKNAGKILLAASKTVKKHGQLDELLQKMDKEKIEYVIFSNVSPNPTSNDVEAGYKIFKDNNCKSIVSIGGGSPIDCAKAIGAKAARPQKSVNELQGVLKVRKKIPLFFAVPTTAGTGSETTIAAVITDSETHRKASINDPAILPEYAVLDPSLTVGLPPYTTAITGMDALCHAVEAYTNHTYNTKTEDDLAKKAVKLIYLNLYKAFEDGTDITARQNMQKAAFFAGRAFTRGCVGYVHAVGHTLGGLYGVPHGEAMAIILPHVMRQYGKAVHKRLADLADVCGLGGKDEAQKSEKFICWIEEMNEKMGIPKGTSAIRNEDKEQIIAWAMKEANPLYPVPVIWNHDDFSKLIAKISLPENDNCH